jgi:hypothetical protein
MFGPEYGNEIGSQQTLIGQLDYREFITTYLNYRSLGMTPYTLVLYAGNYKEYIIYVKDKDLNTVDITGATGVMTMKVTKDGPVVVQKYTGAMGPQGPQGIVAMPIEGEARFYYTPIDTINLEARQYVWDIKITTASGNPYTVLEGVLDLHQPVNP